MRLEYRSIDAVLIAIHQGTDEHVSRWIRFAMLTWPLRPIYIAQTKTDKVRTEPKMFKYNRELLSNVLACEQMSSLKSVDYIFDQALQAGLYYKLTPAIRVKNDTSCHIL
jgi:hypothetical protein